MNTELIKMGAKIKAKKTRKVYRLLLKLKKGAFIIVKKEQWDLSTVPGAWIIRKYTGREFKVQTLISRKGWKITSLGV